MSRGSAGDGASDKQHLRLSKLLSSRMKRGYLIEKVDEKIFINRGEKRYGFMAELVVSMLEAREVELVQDQLKLTDVGLNALNKKLGILPAPGECQLTTDTKYKSRVSQHSGVKVHLDESPMMRLYSRKKPGGGSYISEAQLRAGEQLRLDFERGQLQPNITASYDHPIGNSGRKGATSAGIELSDFALDCRKRLNDAMEKLGPELAGVTLDVCCFLKGLELVERERRWPPRSAKLMLATALSILARHYGLLGEGRNRKAGIRSWGNEDYRPELS